MKKKQLKKHNEAHTFKTCVKSVKISNKKARMIIQPIIGKTVDKAILILSIQKIAVFQVLSKLIHSAISNTSKMNIGINNLLIDSINVDKGRFHKKIFTRSQGRVNYINKKTSQICITLKII